MKTILFCQNPYAFGILEPIMNVLKQKGHPYVWFLGKKIKNFPFQEEVFTRSIGDLISFNADAIYTPGNEVPYYLRGLKVQVFHGLAGEKKSHFRIRHYFDLYLTQGPFFTNKFKQLKKKYKNFEVIETGWPKLDVFGHAKNLYLQEKKELLKKYNAKRIVLYAPTFSPSLTSAPYLINEIKELAKNKDYLIIFKFHDLMSENLIETYSNLSAESENMIFETERNIIKYLLLSDIMISDTSSVVYEFLLLDKPVITFKNNSKIILWDDSKKYNDLSSKVKSNLEDDNYKEQRKLIFESYHPYNDGKSALRMVSEVENYIEKHGVPEKRKLSLFRKYKINKIFG